MAWQAVTDVNDGQSLDGAAWETVKDGIEEVQAAIGPDVPALSMQEFHQATGVYDRATAGVNSAEVTDVNFDTETLDPRNWRTTPANLIRPDVAGWYMSWAEVHWSTSGDTTRLNHIISFNGASTNHTLDLSFPSGTITGATDLVVGPVMTLMNGTTDSLGVKLLQVNADSGQLTVGVRFTVKLIHPT